jgi:Immunoglobulin I-set domain.
VLPSFSLTNLETATVFPTHTYPNGLVFDSRVYSDLSDFSPVQSADSGLAQHLAVMKDFLISTNGASVTNPPAITGQPQSQTVIQGSNATFTVTVNSILPVTYQWLFKGTNILSSMTNSYTVFNAQSSDAGSYSVAVSNSLCGLISSNATLTVVTSPLITTNPASLTVNRGDTVTFTVTAVGAPPLTYQWRFNATNLPGSTTNSYMLVNAQTTNAGNYSVIVTNNGGAVTSAPAVLTVIVPGQTSVIAQWNFNSTTPDGSTTTGATTPSTGVGTASLVGGTTSTFATGDTSLDLAGSTDNSGWNTTGYPASTSGNKTAGVQFNVSTAGKQNIIVSWSQRASATGTKYTRLRYSTNGTTFVDFPTAVSVSVDSVYEIKTNSLSGFAGVDNNTNFAFQIVGEFQSTATGSNSTSYVAAKSGSTYAITGTLRFDMVTMSGSALGITTNPPAAPAMLSAPSYSNSQFQMLVTGTAGSNYVMLAATNLLSTNWIPLFTNVSPFIFTDVNLTTPQKFYRATVQP